MKNSSASTGSSAAKRSPAQGSSSADRNAPTELTRSSSTRLPPRSAIQPQNGGPTIRNTCGSAISTPICAIDSPIAARYRLRYGEKSPT